MPYTLILHVQNTDPVMGEVDELPSPGSNLILVKNPRRVDGKDLPYVSENAVQVMWPVEKLNFIEVLSGEGEEELIGFVRE